MSEQQPDIASQWKSFDGPRREGLLARMSPEQKKSLRTKLESQGTAPDPTSDAPIPGLRDRVDAYLAPVVEKGSGVVGRLKNAAKATAAGLLAPFIHPDETLKGMGEAGFAFGTGGGYPTTTYTGNNKVDSENTAARDAAIQSQVDKAQVAKDSPVYAAASVIGPALVLHGAGKAVRAVMPGSGPGGPGGFRRAAQHLVNADTRAVVKEVGTVADKANTAGERVKAQNQAAEESTLMARGKVDETNAGKLKQDVQKRVDVLRTNREASKSHAQDVANVKAENAKTMAGNADRTRVEGDLQAASKDLSDRHAAAKVSAKAENDAAWAGVRAKVANTPGDVGPIQQQVEISRQYADPTTTPLLNTILKEGAQEGLPVIKSSDGDIAPNHPLYDQVYQMQYGQPPPLEAGPAGVSFERLQRWYSYLGDRLYGGGGKLEPGAYNLYKSLQYAVNEQMQAIADKAGATGDLAAARDSHTHMMETFSDSPNESATNFSKSQQETSPEYAKQQQQQKRLEMMGRYDPEIPGKAQHVGNLREALKKLPKAAPLREQLKPLPERPETTAVPKPAEPTPYGEPADQRAIEPPEVDLQKTREDLIRKEATRWATTSQYQIRRLAVSGISGVLASLAGHSALEGASAGYIVSEFAPKAAAALIEKPRVMQWLSQPSTEDIAALRTIPHIDQVRFIDSVTKFAMDEARAGRAVNLSPDVAAFLGAKSAAAIVGASRPQNAGEAKKRVAELQGR